jgi:hypothetical protein
VRIPAVLLHLPLLFVTLCPAPSYAVAQRAKGTKQVAEITDPENGADDQFGHSVGINGNSMVVGAPQFFGSANHGWAYIVVNSGRGWKVVARLASGDGQSIQFGTSVAVGGDVVVVGTPDDDNGNGVVYVFVKPAGGWKGDLTPTAELTIPPGLVDNLLGTSVAIDSDGKTIVAGGPGQGGASGAYVFVEPEGGWVDMTEPTATLTSSSALEMGNSVAISGNTIVAGEVDNGRLEQVYVFVEPAGGWVDTTQPNATLTGSDEGSKDAFGHVVAISGNTVVAGSAHNTGTVYVFAEPQTGWADMTQTAELTIQAKGDPGLSFAVAITGKVIVASAPGDIIGQIPQGAIFGYVKPAGGWVTTSKPNGSVIASDGGAKEGFGASLAVSGTTMVVGAPDKGGDLQGAVYIFAAQP